MSQSEIENLIELLARLPGIGPRSARRLALTMLKKPDSLMRPLAKSLIDTANSIIQCSICGNLDTVTPCNICEDKKRDTSIIVVIEEVADLWTSANEFWRSFALGTPIVSSLRPMGLI